jgi:large subunit ribosomal protein L19
MSNSCPTIEAIERGYKRTDLPLFRPGDTIRVHALISEGGKERIQVFEGVCIHRKKGGARGSFTVRKVSHGVGVERVWPENSPRVTKVELVSRGRVRRAKLYYLRDLSGNAARIREKLGDYADILSGAPVQVGEADVQLNPEAHMSDGEGGEAKAARKPRSEKPAEEPAVEAEKE